MTHPLRRFASPPSRGAALAVRQSRPGGASGLGFFVRGASRSDVVDV